MTKKSKFLMVSLEGNKAKKLAQIISNDTARKILDILAEGDATETEISTSLKQPISTIHYNLKQLVKAKLVECKEFHYSPKGKEVNHYSLANKYIIIAPKAATETLKDKLKSLIPSLLIVGGIGFAYNFLKSSGAKIIKAGSKSTAQLSDVGGSVKAVAAPMAEAEIAEQTIVEGGRAFSDYAAETLVEETAVDATNAIISAPQTAQVAAPPPVEPVNIIIQQSEPNLFLWFIVGAVSVAVIYLFIDQLRKRFKE